MPDRTMKKTFEVHVAADLCAYGYVDVSAEKAADVPAILAGLLADGTLAERELGDIDMSEEAGMAYGWRIVSARLADDDAEPTAEEQAELDAIENAVLDPDQQAWLLTKAEAELVSALRTTQAKVSDGTGADPDVVGAALRARAEEAADLERAELAEDAHAAAEQAIDAMVSRLAADPEVGRDGALDEIVHEAKASEASEINNGVTEAQLRYLIKAGVTAEEIRGAAREANLT